MTNPDNIVRVRARNGGRASVYEANGWAQAFSSGLFEGNGVTQNTSADMHVLVGGSSSKPDVVLAKNPSDYKVALDIVGQQAITLTAPASNSRISAIVAYTDDLSLSTGQTTVTGSPASCGLIVVNGSASSNPSAPTDTQIRNAITTDGATGSQASYAVIATVRVAHNTTVITNALITTNRATLNVANNVPDASITANKIDFTTFGGNYSTTEVNTGYTWIDGKKIYKKTIFFGALPNSTSKSVAHGITGLSYIVNWHGMTTRTGDNIFRPLPLVSPASATTQAIVEFDSTYVYIYAGNDRSAYAAYITLYYTKN